MFCEHCGAQNKENSAFCKKCGKPLTATHDITNDMQNSLVYNQLPIDQIKQKNKKLTIAFIIAFVVFIVTTGIICVFTQGLMNNILITLASCVLPGAVGIDLIHLEMLLETIMVCKDFCIYLAVCFIAFALLF